MSFYDYEGNVLESGGSGTVKTVNGIEPDENGNVVIATGGSSAVRIDDVELPAANWSGDASPYYQIVAIPGVTPYSQVDLTPNVEQLAIFHDKDLAFVTENEDGVVTVYAIGDKPLNDYTMQVTIKEVSA